MLNCLKKSVRRRRIVFYFIILSFYRIKTLASSQNCNFYNLKSTIYTIGHSNHPIEDFLELLQKHQINCLVDVRSVPASGRFPQFNKKPLRKVLQNHEMLYMHFDKEFGARQEDKAVHNEAGQVDFEKFQQTEIFQAGIERLKKGLEKDFNIVLMCSEGNPLECHRFSMIAVKLVEEGFDLQHILRDGASLSHPELEEQLMKKYRKKLPQPSLFEPNISKEDQKRAAYRLHNADIGWAQQNLYRQSGSNRDTE